MAETNYLIFNEENSPDRTYNDSEYKNATQRLSGVIPGMALSRQHNKMYFQWSAMCKAIADFLVSAGHDCMDNNVEGITEALQQTINSMTGDKLSEHNVAEDAHSNLFAQKLDKIGGTLSGDLSASGHNITADKFIGDLQGNADTATNAENANYAINAGTASNANNATYATTAGNANSAVKANQDSAGQQIDTTYVKDVTSNGSTLTVTKGNGTSTQITVTDLNKVYPVGSIYMSVLSTNPAELFGIGTWEAMPAGRVLLAQGQSDWGTNYAAGSTGGEHQHQLTVGEMPAHNHTGWTDTQGLHQHSVAEYAGQSEWIHHLESETNSGLAGSLTSANGAHAHNIGINVTGGNQAHNNLQPYLVVYMWKRIS